MARWVTVFVVAAVALGANAAWAQETSGAGRWEITGFPGGGLLFTEGSRDTGEPDFGNYALGASLTYNLNRYWGIEGEVGGGIGIDQRLTFNDGRPSIPDASPPDMFAYNGSVLLYPLTNERRFAAYVTGGVGGLTILEKVGLGVDDNTTFLTGNAGAGVKAYFGRWSVRGDYRFLIVDAKNDAPAFFGRADTRYGHRIYGGLVFGFGW